MSPKQERTYVMVKPDGVKRGLIGEIIRRFEQRGLKIVALSMVRPAREQMDNHYPKSEAWIKRLGEKTLNTYAKYGYDPIKELGTTDAMEIGKQVRGWLLDFMTSAPVVKMVVEGVHAIDMVRKLAGETMPSAALVGTIRGDYSVDSPAAANKEKRSVMNIVHASETQEEAMHEIAHWFKPTEICDYSRAEEDCTYTGEGAA
jgi:nucleoside-diphosphate kinase